MPTTQPLTQEVIVQMIPTFWSVAFMAVSALAMIVTAVATTALAIMTRKYVRNTADAVRTSKDEITAAWARAEAQFKRQLSMRDEQEKLRLQRAVRAIIGEIECNAFAVMKEKKSPLLDTAYSSSLWVLSEVPICAATERALADAYLNIKKFNYEYDPRVAGQDEKDRGWNLAAESVPAALAQLRADKELQEFLK